MKLDVDCVRAVLFELEKLPFNSETNILRMHNSIPGFSQDEIEYACLKLHEADFVELSTVHTLGNCVPRVCSITGLTFKGHEFLEQIREPSRWEKVKEVAKNVGSYSLPILSDIAKELLVAAAKAAIAHYIG